MQLQCFNPQDESIGLQQVCDSKIKRSSKELLMKMKPWSPQVTCHKEYKHKTGMVEALRWRAITLSLSAAVSLTLVTLY